MNQNADAHTFRILLPPLPLRSAGDGVRLFTPPRRCTWSATAPASSTSSTTTIGVSSSESDALCHNPLLAPPHMPLPPTLRSLRAPLPGQPLTRQATIIVYLEDTAGGGATFFPRSSGACVHRLNGCKLSSQTASSCSPVGIPGTDGNLMIPQPLTASAVAALSLTMHGERHIRPGLRVYPSKGRAILFW